MTRLWRGDADLHHDNGEHRTTSPSTSGTAIANHERRLRAHLEAHGIATSWTPVAAPRASAPDWRSQHETAMMIPNETEAPFVALLTAINTLIERHGNDYVLRDGIAHLIMGTQALLNGETGRLDCGSIDTTLNAQAARIGFDLDREVFDS